MKKQEDIWKENLKYITPQDVLEQYRQPAEFQKELRDYINSIKISNSDRKIIEIGCETGVTSFLLSSKFERYLLDLNPIAINLAEQAAEILNINAKFIVGNMFKMEIKDESFDLIFNAGVIEHFNKMHRIEALIEYKRILKKDGKMIICFPNHYCIPYRIAYKILTLFNKWKYPKEFKIYDLNYECKKAKLEIVERITVSKSTIYDWLKFSPKLYKIIKYIEKFIEYEGYLTIVLIKKI